MKKIFICALAAGMFTACSQEETISQQSPTQISFAGAFVENATRAAVDPSITTANITNFDVWGFMENTTGEVFTQEKVTKAGSDWTYAGTQYWVKDKNFYFAAVAPSDKPQTNIKVNTTSAGVNGLGVIDFTNVDAGNIDLLYSAVGPLNGTTMINDSKKVEFTFHHMLSKVKFTITNGFAAENANIIITDIKMTAPKHATIDVSKDKWWEGHNWSAVDGTVTLAFGNMDQTDTDLITSTDGKKLLPSTKSVESANECLTIPAVDTQEYTVTFSVEVRYGDVVAYQAQQKTATIKGVALERGKAYNFVTTLDATNFSDQAEEEPLKPIEFNVIAVDEWDYTPGEVPVAQLCDTEGELTAAITKGGDIILNTDITLSTSLKISESTTINLNGKTLTNKVDNTSTDVIVVDEGATLTINGEGTVEAVTGNDGYAVIADGTVIINGGTFKSGVDATGKANAVVYARNNGKVYVNGGTFPNESNSAYVLNKKDADRATTVISVTGGTFTNFNPANNAAEGAGTNFLAEGYKSTETTEGSNVWTVTKDE